MFNNITFNNNIKKYCDIYNWGFYKINLNIEPFNLFYKTPNCFNRGKKIIC